MARAFAEMINRRIDERGWSLRDFAQRAEPSYTPDGAVGYVSKILNGKGRLPAKKIERWADALRLDGAERDRFVALAWLSRGDQRVEDHVITLERELAALRAEIARRRSAD